MDKVLVGAFGSPASMRIRTLLLFCKIVFITLSARALELTPHFSARYAAGVAIFRPYFVDGIRKFTVTLPADTDVWDGDGGVVFRFKKMDQAFLALRKSPLTPERPFDGQSAEAYRDAALRSVPSGATNLVIESEIFDPFPINQWKSHGVIVSYHNSGWAVRQCVVFLNFSGKQQILFITSALEKSFDEALALSWGIIRSWRTMVPGEDLSTPENG